MPDPLSQLRDIHTPEPIGWWPPAPGWWILGLLIVAVMIIALISLYRTRQKKRYRIAARSELLIYLAQLEKDADHKRYCQSVNQILRRTAIHAFGHSQVASLTGTDWTSFLDLHLAEGEGFTANGFELDQLPYQREVESVDAQRLHNIAVNWVQSHKEQS